MYRYRLIALGDIGLTPRQRHTIVCRYRHRHKILPLILTSMGSTAVSVSPKPAESVDKLTLIRNHPLFRHLTSAILEQLAARMTKKAGRRGAVLFRKGEGG